MRETLKLKNMSGLAKEGQHGKEIVSQPAASGSNLGTLNYRGQCFKNGALIVNDTRTPQCSIFQISKLGS